MSANKTKVNLKKELSKGKELFTSGNYVDAKDIFETLYDTHPDDKEVQNYLGMVLFKLGLHKEAMELYKELLEKVPNFPSLHLNLGIIYYKEGLLDLAFEEFLNTLEFDPNNERAQNYLGLIHMAKGNYDEALTTFELTGSKKMIKDVKEKIRESKREEYYKKKTGIAGEKEEKPQKKEEPTERAISKGKGKVSFSDIKKVQAAARHDVVSTVKETAEELMRNIFMGGSDSDFIDTYQNLVKLNVKKEIYSKLSLLESFSGDLEFKGANKIIQKKKTDIPLGPSDDLIYNVVGDGSLLLSLGSQMITALYLDKEELYVKDKYLLAFEKSVNYENSSKAFDEESDLIKLSGSGAAILLSGNRPITQKIDKGSPLAIKLEYIIAWYGNLSSKIIKDKYSLFKVQDEAKWASFKGNGYVFCLVKD
jgi:tetratricopeptide (TPR) repeat protein